MLYFQRGFTKKQGDGSLLENMEPRKMQPWAGLSGYSDMGIIFLLVMPLPWPGFVKAGERKEKHNNQTFYLETKMGGREIPLKIHINIFQVCLNVLKT